MNEGQPTLSIVLFSTFVLIPPTPVFSFLSFIFFYKKIIIQGWLLFNIGSRLPSFDEESRVRQMRVAQDLCMRSAGSKNVHNSAHLRPRSEGLVLHALLQNARSPMGQWGVRRL